MPNNMYDNSMLIFWFGIFGKEAPNTLRLWIYVLTNQGYATKSYNFIW